MLASRVESGCTFADERISNEKALFQTWGTKGYIG
jgi:hypothetical protein